MIFPIPRLYAAAGAALVLVATVGGLWVRGNYYESKADTAIKALETYQASAAAVIAERLRAQQEEARAHELRVQETIKTYDSRTASLQRRYDDAVRQLRDPPAAGNRPAGVPEAGAPAQPADGGAEREPTARFLRDLEACDRDRERLRALQEWARSVTR